MSLPRSSQPEKAARLLIVQGSIYRGLREWDATSYIITPLVITMSKSNSQLLAEYYEHRWDDPVDKKRLRQFKESLQGRSRKVRQNAEVSESGFLSKLIQQVKRRNEHRMSPDELEAHLQTNLRVGLSSAQAWLRLDRDGQNIVKFQEAPHWSILFLKEMATPLSMAFWLAAVLYFLNYKLGSDLSNLYLGLIIVAIILVTAILATETKTQRIAIAQPIKIFISPQVTVMREGNWMYIHANQLVVGDVIDILVGMKLPADVRIIQSQGVKVDNSALTGDSRLQARSPLCTSDNYLDSENMAFYSTYVKEGRGRAVVVATGSRTFLGAIGEQTQQTIYKLPPDSVFQQQFDSLLVCLAIFSVIVAAVFFGIGFAVGYPLTVNLHIAIGLITANAPLCLPLLLIIGLKLQAKSLALKNVLLKDVNSIQKLASLTTICCDKTGILTKNKLTVSSLWFNGEVCKSDSVQKWRDDGFNMLHEGVILSEPAYFDRFDPAFSANEPCEMWPTIGEGSGSALIRFFQSIQDIDILRDKSPLALEPTGRECRVLFNSIRKYQYSIRHHQTKDSHYSLFVKGTVDKLWNLSSTLNITGREIPKSAEASDILEKNRREFEREGVRIVAFASRRLPRQQYPPNYKFEPEKEDLVHDLCFLGVIMLTDPPRPSVPSAVERCRAAGVRVIMLTGGSVSAALATAKECNIITQETVNQIANRTDRGFNECFEESQSIVIEGEDVMSAMLDDEGLPKEAQGKQFKLWLTKQEIVFARVSPAHKLEIVKACQRMGEVVAVTGDGVGDSPALKAADIGISLSSFTSDTALEAADVVLLNDEIASIVDGIEEARKAFSNIKKAVCYSLSSQIGLMLPFIVMVAFQIPCYTCSLVLYVSIAVDFIPCLCLMLEPAEIGIMTRRGRRNNQDQLITFGIIGHAYGVMGWGQFWAAILCFYVTFNDFGFTPTQLTKIATLPMVKSNPGDVYNPIHATFGNTYLQQHYLSNCPPPSQDNLVDWLYTSTAVYDIRNSLLTCSVTAGRAVYSQAITWGQCNIQQVSPFTNLPICYTPQAGKYAQTAYFIGLVWGHLFNFIISRTNRSSSISQGFTTPALIAITAQVMAVLLATYFFPFNIAFGTRDVIFMHYGIAALPFCMLLFLLDEARKSLMRGLSQGGKHHWFSRLASW